MPEKNNEKELDRIAEDIRRQSKVLLENLAEQLKGIKKVKAMLTPAQFERWAAIELNMDMPTLRDYLAFDGTMNTVTENMMRFALDSTGGRRS